MALNQPHQLISVFGASVQLNFNILLGDGQWKGAQTIDEMQKLAESKKKATEKYGCVRQPLLNTIPVNHIIPNVLLLFLRICDVLINLLITELRRLDGLEKARVQKIDHTKVVNIKMKLARLLFIFC